MSSERTWVDSSIRLPEWLGLCLRDEPRDADHLARLCETAIAAAIGPAAGVAVALEGVSGTPREGLNVANAVIEVAKWRLAKIPSAALVSSLSSRATGRSRPRPRADSITSRCASMAAQIEHLRCETIVIAAEAVVGGCPARDRSGTWSWSLRATCGCVRRCAPTTREMPWWPSRPSSLMGACAFSPEAAWWRTGGPAGYHPPIRSSRREANSVSEPGPAVLGG